MQRGAFQSSARFSRKALVETGRQLNGAPRCWAADVPAALPRYPPPAFPGRCPAPATELGRLDGARLGVAWGWIGQSVEGPQEQARQDHYLGCLDRITVVHRAVGLGVPEGSDGASEQIGDAILLGDGHGRLRLPQRPAAL